MMVILFLGIFYSIYGILGLFGVQVIPLEYKGKNWTKGYICCRGVSWLLLGFPWLAFYLIVHSMNINTLIEALILIAISIPSVVFSFFSERKYKSMLKNNQE